MFMLVVGCANSLYGPLWENGVRLLDQLFSRTTLPVNPPFDHKTTTIILPSDPLLNLMPGFVSHFLTGLT